MTTIFCNIMKREYKIKKICKQFSGDRPNNATYFTDAYCTDGHYTISRTPAGHLYAIKTS